MVALKLRLASLLLWAGFKLREDCLTTFEPVSEKPRNPFPALLPVFSPPVYRDVAEKQREYWQAECLPLLKRHCIYAEDTVDLP